MASIVGLRLRQDRSIAVLENNLFLFRWSQLRSNFKSNLPKNDT